MVVVTFPDTKTKRKAIGFLAGRFSARVHGTGEIIVPEAAVEALAAEDFNFTVLGKATYEQMAAIRTPAAAPIE